MEQSRFQSIIRKYDKIFSDYYVRSKKDVLPILSKQRQKYDFILKKINSFYFITNFLSQFSGMKTNVVEENSLFTIYNKSALDLLSIFYCLYNGLEIQAGIILRSLYETYIYNDFIFKEHTKEKLRLFYEFQFVERWIHIVESVKFNSNYFQDMNLSQTDIEAIKLKYDKYKDNYHPKYPYSWAFKYFNRNPSLLEICKYLGDEYVREYISVYGVSSKQIHLSAMIGDYFTANEDKIKISLNSPQYKDTIVSTGIVSLEYCSYVILDIIKYFRIKNYNEISTYIKHFFRYFYY
ncbi:MAG: hypothetical protein UZ05_CHB002001449 [Chlorobi bacterium OLB5]|nr:MAG: hypothetical protein UZ05_CHB002001449 [Chlorobi bacterium OLB5]